MYLACTPTAGNLEVDAVAEVCITAVRVEQAFGTQAVDGLSRWYQVVTGDADPNLLFLQTFNVGRGGHAGPISLTDITAALTGSAITLKS